MAKATVTSLTEKERALIAETQPARSARARRGRAGRVAYPGPPGRDKFVKLHRRETAAQVIDAGARGVVNAGPRRSASKAEIFEDALARVSTSLAKAARESARALRDERLAAARGTAASTVEPAKVVRDDSPAVPRPRSTPPQPIERKLAASTRSTGARRQAERDARER